MTHDELIFVRIKERLVDNEWLLEELKGIRKKAVALGKEKNSDLKEVKTLSRKADVLFNEVVRNAKRVKVLLDKEVACFVARLEKQELTAGELASEADGLYEELLNAQEHEEKTR